MKPFNLKEVSINKRLLKFKGKIFLIFQTLKPIE